MNSHHALTCAQTYASPISGAFGTYKERSARIEMPYTYKRLGGIPQQLDLRMSVFPI